MPTLNKVFLLGNLTRDPDLRGLPSGQSVCEMRMAITRRYNSNGKDVDETCFVDVVVWGKSANNCKQFLTKGSQIMVEGRLQLDQWEDRNGGGQRSKLRVVAEQVQFMNRRPQEGGFAPRENGPYQDGGSYGAQGNSYGGGSYGAPANGGYGAQGGSTPYASNGGSYGAPNGSYGAPAGGYAAAGSYGAPGNGYGRADSGYDSYNRSVNPPPAEEPMPPMPSDNEGGENGGMVDDIPF